MECFKSKFAAVIMLSACAANGYAGGLKSDLNMGKIHFTGEVIEAACEIDGGSDINVPLGQVPTAQFQQVGDHSKLTEFTIDLVNCPTNDTGIQADLTFSGVTTLTGSKTLLDVSKITTDGTTAATGVGIALSVKDHDDTLISFDGAEDQVPLELMPLKEDTVQVYLNARYVSFSPTVTAGPADADLSLNIVYK
ncbi:fimbrial protein [Atlantibacter sp.]|uniref:fimbrial protein n=1 Tax=Atlantibacter sp. TaxID=1903473 RepID=UPI0028B00DE1|nr:fimbrial protein [Atlantibacter sp.]